MSEHIETGTARGLDQQAQDRVAAWIRTQLDLQDLTVATLAERSAVSPQVLDRIVHDHRGLDARHVFKLVASLGHEPSDVICELGLLSERGLPYLDYCQRRSEAPLADLWKQATHLCARDRTLLLECVLHERRKRWHPE